MSCSLFSLFGGKEAICVASTINVEADELTVVVKSVDSGGTNTIRVVNRLPLSMMPDRRDQEAMHLFRAIDVDSDDLV